MAIRGVVLSGESLGRVREAGGPLEVRPDWLESLKLNDIPAVEVDGRIVAYWPAWVAVHVEPLWVDPAYRGPGIIRVLVETLFGHLREAGVDSAFAILGHADQGVTLHSAIRLGFQRVPGDLYVVDLRGGEGGIDHGRSRPVGDLAGDPAVCEPPRE